MSERGPWTITISPLGEPSFNQPFKGEGHKQVEVITVDSPQVLSPEEARLLVKAHGGILTDEEHSVLEATANRLADYAKEAEGV